MWEDSVLLEDLVSGLCFIRNSFSNLMTNQEAWFRAEPQAVCGKNDAQCYIYFHHLWWAVHVSHLLPAKFWVIPLKVHLTPKNHFSLSLFQSKVLILDEQSCLFQPSQDCLSFLGVEREKKKGKMWGKVPLMILNQTQPFPVRWGRAQHSPYLVMVFAWRENLGLWIWTGVEIPLF